MANRDLGRGGPLWGDDLYGDRESLRRYRDYARNEHRRFWAEYERSEQGGRLPRVDSLTEYDRFEEDLTGGDFRPTRRHATQGGYSYGSFSGVTPEGRALDYQYPFEVETPRNRGRGPRGYRSDERIYADVCELLTDDDRIDASEIEVSVSSGEVTLSGRVRGRNAKRRATDLVERVRGVRQVYNNIRVSDEQHWPPQP